MTHPNNGHAAPSQSVTPNTLLDTLQYVKTFANSTVAIKLGGSILHDHQLIRTLCTDLQLLRGANIKIILIHGGSKAINEALATHQIPSAFCDGLRVTSKAAMDIIEMVLSGHVNALIVRQLNAIGMPAIGLSGTDGQLLLADYYSTQHGFVGKIKQVNAGLLRNLLANQNQPEGMIPVIAPVGTDAQGNALNINADWAAAAIACEIHCDKLIYLTDQDGIYNQQKQVISQLNNAQLHQLVEQSWVTDGMLTKVRAIQFALQQGLQPIHIINGSRPHSLIEELFTTKGIGSLITADVLQSTDAKGQKIETLSR